MLFRIFMPGCRKACYLLGMELNNVARYTATRSHQLNFNGANIHANLRCAGKVFALAAQHGKARGVPAVLTRAEKRSSTGIKDLPFLHLLGGKQFPKRADS